jgi:hypothetical protein
MLITYIKWGSLPKFFWRVIFLPKLSSFIDWYCYWGVLGVYRNLSLCPDQLPNLLSDYHQTLWNLRSWCVNFAVCRILLSIEFYPCYASLDLEILRQFSMHFVIANSPTWLIRSSWNFVHCKILIWRCAY